MSFLCEINDVAKFINLFVTWPTMFCFNCCFFPFIIDG